jgi:hypothetical protein
MTQGHATPEHFALWRKNAEALDTYSLRYVIKDCRQAAQCMRSFDQVREGFYEDQAFTYADELYRRRSLTHSGTAQ